MYSVRNVALPLTNEFGHPTLVSIEEKMRKPQEGRGGGVAQKV